MYTGWCWSVWHSASLVWVQVGLLEGSGLACLALCISHRFFEFYLVIVHYRSGNTPSLQKGPLFLCEVTAQLAIRLAITSRCLGMPTVPWRSSRVWSSEQDLVEVFVGIALWCSVTRHTSAAATYISH